MKKLTKILAVLLACITVFSSASMAAEGDTAEETTTAVTEEITTTTAQEETTTTVQEETTTAVLEETTTEAQEETTTEVPEETTTAVQEETTTTPEEEITTTQPEKPDVVLPPAPTRISEGRFVNGGREISWPYVAQADGYDVYLKIDGEWVLQTSTTERSIYLTGLLKCNWYDVAVKSYIIVDGVKYDSEEYCTGIVNGGGFVSGPVIKAISAENGIKLTWNELLGSSGYELYLKQDGKLTLIKSFDDIKITEYIYEDAVLGQEYEFLIKAYVTTPDGLQYSPSEVVKLVYTDHTKAVITLKNPSASTVYIKWQEVDNAASYRVYIYKNGKWIYYKGIKKTEYKIKDLEASTKYKIKVRACFKNDGEVTWGTYSDTVSVTTDSKKVKSYRVGKLKKYFTDGDWSVKVTGLKDEDYGTFDYTLAVKGNKIFVRYDFKNNKNVRDFEYLIDADKEKVYVIFDDDKTYAIFKDDDAYGVVYSVVMMAAILDMSDAKNVTAKTTIYSGKTAVAEIYTDKELGIKKTYYFINDKVKALKVTYADGSTETMKISKINDTPSSSVFKLPSGYKKITY